MVFIYYINIIILSSEILLDPFQGVYYNVELFMEFFYVSSAN